MLLHAFHAEMPNKGTDYFQTEIDNMTNDKLACAMEFGSPKLGLLRDWLDTLVGGQKKVILWTYWPLSQWLVREVRTILIPSESESGSGSGSDMWGLYLNTDIKPVRSIAGNQLLCYP